MKKVKKILIAAAVGAVVLLFVLVGGVFVMFGDEFATLGSIKKINNYPLYTIDCHNNYGLAKLSHQGVDNDQQLIQFASKQLLKGLPLNIKVPKVACTTFAEQTPNGDHIMGRNFDLRYSPSAVVRTAPKDGYKSLSMTDLNFIGFKKNSMDNYKKRVLALAAPYIPFDGINQKGVSAAVLWVPDKTTNQQTGKPGITTSIAIRMILDHAKNTKQALAILKKHDMHASAAGCYHFQINDAAGNSAVVEYANNKMSVLPQKGNHQLLTNFYQTPGTQYHHGVGFDRYQKANQILNHDKGIQTPKQAMKTLDVIHNGPSQPYQGKSKTQWSVVYNNTKKTMAVAVGSNFKKIYHFKVN